MKNRFYAMVDSCGSRTISQCWDRENHCYDSSLVASTLVSGSSGERVMLRFFLGVWLHQNLFNFDLFDGLAALDETNRAIIVNWANDPFYP